MIGVVRTSSAIGLEVRYPEDDLVAQRPPGPLGRIIGMFPPVELGEQPGLRGGVELREGPAAPRHGSGVDRVEAGQDAGPGLVGIPLRHQQIHEFRHLDIHRAGRVGAGQQRVRQRGDQHHLRGAERLTRRPAPADMRVEVLAQRVPLLGR
jgi:hypothetical protein